MEQIVCRASLITVRKHNSFNWLEKKVLLLISCSVLNVKVFLMNSSLYIFMGSSKFSDTMDRASRQALRNSWR